MDEWIKRSIDVIKPYATAIELAVSCIPNHTNKAKAWYSELVKEDDPIGIMVKGIQRLKLFNKIALESGHTIEGVGDGK
jgi:hypothetical protein